MDVLFGFLPEHGDGIVVTDLKDALSVEGEYVVYGDITSCYVGDLLNPEIVEVPRQYNPDSHIVLYPGQQLVCDYTSDVLPNELDGVNTAIASAHLEDVRPYLVASSTGYEPYATSMFSGKRYYSFEDARIRGELDRRAIVTDSITGLLGKVDVDAMPTVFIYNVLISPASYGRQCGERWLHNIAKVTGKDTGAYAKARESVPGLGQGRPEGQQDEVLQHEPQGLQQEGQEALRPTDLQGLTQQATHTLAARAALHGPPSPRSRPASRRRRPCSCPSRPTASSSRCHLSA